MQHDRVWRQVMRAFRRGCTWLLLGAIACSTGVLQAQPLAAHPGPLRMHVEVDPCVGVDSASFQRQLAIELEAAAQARHLVRAQNRLRIALGCVEDEVSVAITDSVARRTWRRKVELQGVDARARTRLLALSVAELLLASRLELHMDAMQPTRREARRRTQPAERARALEPTPAPDQAPVQAQRLEDTDEAQEPDSAIAPQPHLHAPSTSPPPAAREADVLDDPEQRVPSVAPPMAPEAEPPSPQPEAAESETEPSASERVLPVPLLQLGAAGNALAFSSSFTLIPGGELHVGVPLSASWALRGAVQAGHGRLQGTVSTPRGPLDSLVRITAGSVALSLHALTHAGNLELSLGAGVRVGLARLVGEPTDLQQESVRSYAPWAGPLLSPSLRYRFSAVVAVSVGIEAGVMAVRVRALGPENTLVTQLHGLWMLLSLGLDLALLP